MSIDWRCDTTDPALLLQDLGEGMPGISPVFGAAVAEAASVCLSERDHSSPKAMAVQGVMTLDVQLKWDAPTAQARRAWADPEVATEFGAYGIASLLITLCCPLTIVERSRKGTGFDFWLGSQDDPGPLFQARARLEVSGIRQGSDQSVASRTRQKLTQTDRSAGALPAVVVVVEFSQPLSHLSEKWTT